MTQLLRVIDLAVEFPVKSPILRRRMGQIQAVRGVSFELRAGETLALVGESGSGKSTVARAIARLASTALGRIEFEGVDLLKLSGARLRRARRNIQTIFQNPYSSLNRAWRVDEIVAEPLRAYGIGTAPERREAVAVLLDRVGLAPEIGRRRPAGLSGGQRQRVGIARAIALRPQLVICDEATSALDVSVQAQILNLLVELREEFGLSYLFITHDLGVVRRLAERVAVMHAGLIVETAPTRALFAQALHPYTDALLAAAPNLENVERVTASRTRVSGSPPSPLSTPPGCLFAARCPFALARCHERAPLLAPQPDARLVACHRVQNGIAEWRESTASQQLSNIRSMPSR